MPGGAGRVVSRLEREGGPEGSLGLVELALILEENPEFEPGLGRAGLDRDRGDMVALRIDRSV